MTSFDCPHCQEPCLPGMTACPACHLRLVGPEAYRLWEVHLQIGRLQAEADRLIAVLLAPASAVSAGPGVPSGPSGRPVAAAAVRRPLSGQQVLLGLGTMLLLSAAAFFLLVAWLLVGVTGQVAIMLGVTVVAAAGTVLATRRGLPAAAETSAVLASGFVLIDLAGAHALGLAGLDAVPGQRYWTFGCLLAGLVLLGADLLVPRRVAGRPAHRIRVYRPVAGAMLALAPWLALAWADPAGNGLPVGLLLVALANGATALGLGRLDASAAVTRARPVAAGIALASGVVALGASVVTAPLAAIAAVAVLVAAAMTAGLLGHVGGLSRLPEARVRDLGLAGAVAQPLLVVAIEWRAETLGTAPLALMVVPSLAWLVTSVAGATRTRLAGWLLAAHVAAAAALARLVTDRGEFVGVVVALAAFVGCTALAMTAVRRAGVSLPEERIARFWTATERITVGFGAGYAVAAVAAAAQVGAHAPRTVALTCFVIGVATLVHAASPGRLAFAYLGSLAISAGSDVLAADAGVETVEVYTLPLVILLAGVGLVQWRRDHRLPTMLTLGPSLSVLLLPSTLAAIAGGDGGRLAGVTCAGVAAVIVGLVRRWKAPVTVGSVVLATVAVTQGGPYVSYVPGWVTLGLAGSVLLAIGVSWERAVLTGRRANAWYGTLR